MQYSHRCITTTFLFNSNIQLSAAYTIDFQGRLSTSALDSYSANKIMTAALALEAPDLG